MRKFSRLKFDATKIHSVMSDPECTKNKKKYEKLLVDLANEEAKLNAMINRDGPGAFKREEKIIRLGQELDELEPIKDKENLSNKLKSYLKAVFIRIKYDKIRAPTEQKKLWLTKGYEVEPDAICLVNSIDGTQYTKNKDSFSNEWVRGIPDIIVKNAESSFIREIKASYDAYSFYLCSSETVTNIIFWQVQVYMWLTDTQEAFVDRCLVDTPEHIIKEAQSREECRRRLAGQLPSQIEKAIESIKKRLQFGDIPEVERRTQICIPRDDEAIGRIAKRIEMCREFLMEYAKEHKNRFTKHV